MLNARRLYCSQRGVAALEFALIAPLLTTLVIGVFDITKSVILWQQVCNTARTVVVSASTLSVQPDRSTSLTVAQVQQAMSAIYAEMPWIRDGIETGRKSVTLSSITFALANAACVASAKVTCAYNAAVTWSVGYIGGVNPTTHVVDSFTVVTRPCKPAPTQILPTATVASGQLLSVLRTKNVTQPDPILVADVHYQYTPLFLNFITGPLDFWESSYWSARSVVPGAAATQDYTHYDIANQAGGAGKCSPWQ